mmetsp:Transcript_126741/g.370406  ORF Transcript_126741/g.370406 Transcript_126741/m.370406 type:complete len:265 (-) Transcript_126741:232-1026(-)
MCCAISSSSLCSFLRSDLSLCSSSLVCCFCSATARASFVSRVTTRSSSCRSSSRCRPRSSRRSLSRRRCSRSRSSLACSRASFSRAVAFLSSSRSSRMRSSTARSSSSWCSSCSFFFRSSKRFRCSSSYSCSHLRFASSMSRQAVVVRVVAVAVEVVSGLVLAAGLSTTLLTVVVTVVVAVVVVSVAVCVAVATHRNVMLLITITPEGPSTMSSVSPSLKGIFTVFEKVYGPATSCSAPFRKTVTLLLSFPQEFPKSRVSTPLP